MTRKAVAKTARPGARRSSTAIRATRIADVRSSLTPSSFILPSSARSALRKASLEDDLRQAVLHHLDRAAGDHPAARAAHAVLDQRLLGVAEAAHDLQRLVGDVEAGLVAHELGDGGLVRRREAAVGVGRRAVEQQARGVELHLHVRELPLQALELAQLPAELPAVQGVFAGGVEAVLLIG